MRPGSLSPRSRAVARACAAGVGGVLLASLFVLPAEGVALPPAEFGWVAAGSALILVPLLLCTGIWTAAGAYAAVFWCFHFGFVAVLASGLMPYRELSLWNQLWLLGSHGADAALLALLGLAAFAAAAVLVHTSIPESASSDGDGGEEPADAVHPHGPAGSLLVLAGVLLWAVIVVASSGLAGFFGSYGDYLHATAAYSGPMTVVWLAIGCGFVLSMTGRRGRLRTAAAAAFGLLALIALPLGLRGEILFPTVAALVAAARCGWNLSAGKACAFLAALLLLIPAVREVRSGGLRGLPEVVFDLQPFDALAEMGGSLHPVEKVVRWRAEGEPFDMGASYWAPIERAAARVLPGLRSAAADDDVRIMNVLVTERVGAIGFSPVAEAYRNFGTAGVVLVMALLGALIAAIDRIGTRSRAVLVMAVLYVPLLVNVRNSFVSVPFQCVLGLMFVGGLAALRHAAASIVCRPYARPSYVRSEV